MARPPGATLLSNQLWAKHEAHYFRAFLRALELLREKPALPLDEVGLNRELYFCLLQANREIDPDGAYPPPMAECCNQPDPDDDVRAKRETKRPDFNWGFTDPHEGDFRTSAKQFVVECKRLGIPARPDWILNENYVEHGIWRFVHPSWSYAKRFPSAVMVGYWQTMEPDEILNEVNQVADSRGLAAIRLSADGWQVAAVSRLEHQLIRAFPVSPLRLQHLWIDLRNKGGKISSAQRAQPRKARKTRERPL